MAAAHQYLLENSADPRAVPVTLSAPPPARHHNLFALCSKRPDGSGFLLSDGSFVDRARAAEVAIAAGQTDALKWPPFLYSEDLW